MSETPIPISFLNDFIFCPVSIYFHGLDEEDSLLTQNAEQLNGTSTHKNSDLATYSTKKNMLQYSVYEIENSERVLNNIITDINNKCIKQFNQSDSVYIFHMSSSCKIHKYGYAKNEDCDLMIVT